MLAVDYGSPLDFPELAFAYLFTCILNAHSVPNNLFQVELWLKRITHSHNLLLQIKLLDMAWPEQLLRHRCCEPVVMHLHSQNLIDDGIRLSAMAQFSGRTSNSNLDVTARSRCVWVQPWVGDSAAITLSQAYSGIHSMHCKRQRLWCCLIAFIPLQRCTCLLLCFHM